MLLRMQYIIQKSLFEILISICSVDLTHFEHKT